MDSKMQFIRAGVAGSGVELRARLHEVRKGKKTNGCRASLGTAKSGGT